MSEKKSFCSGGDCAEFERLENGDIAIRDTKDRLLGQAIVGSEVFAAYIGGLKQADGEVGAADIFVYALNPEADAVFSNLSTDEFEVAADYAKAGRLDDLEVGQPVVAYADRHDLLDDVVLRAA
jgi:hypothetical protein